MGNNELKTKRAITAAVIIGLSLCLGSQANAQDDKPFYRGGFDDQIVEAPNGAKVNAQYQKFLSEGAFSGPQVIEVREGVWTVAGYSFNNYTFVEGKTGLIAFDTGVSVGQGQEALKLVQEKVNKPVVAIIYSHFHYTGGAKAFAASNSGKKLKVYAHPDLESNLASNSSILGPMQNLRGGIQLGFYLPKEGPDAYYGVPEPHFEEPELAAHGHMPVTHPVKDGEKVTIDGLKVVFYHTVADTRDSLIAYFPDLKLALHNSAATNMLMSLYTLRGDYYRTPVDLVAGIDKLRSLNAEHVVGVHGLPVSGKDAEEFLLAHRDAYAFTYNQAVRSLNKGMNADEMVEAARLPKHLRDTPAYFPAYVDHEHNVRGQYRGIVGWFQEDTADLHPPTTQEMGETIIKLAGGIDQLIAEAKSAFAEKKYNLSAKLLSYAIAAEPENKQAKQQKADALRQMAYTTQSGIQVRSFMLTEALHLEGKLDWKKPPANLMFAEATVDSILAADPLATLKMLEINIDPIKSAEVGRIIEIKLTDQKKSWALHVRRGVAEVSENVPEKVDATIEIPFRTFAEIMTGDTTLPKEIEAGTAKIKGSQEALTEVINSFDKVAKDDVNPGHLHN
jgi:alkyl sulfatase BDS1-like metallo-beta-lactamase superfamily hydrolase